MIKTSLDINLTSYNEMNNRTTITIDKKVHEKLKEQGRFGETYTELISRLIDINDIKNYPKRVIEK
jgi:hypothetical protein